MYKDKTRHFSQLRCSQTHKMRPFPFKPRPRASPMEAASTQTCLAPPPSNCNLPSGISAGYPTPSPENEAPLCFLKTPVRMAIIKKSRNNKCWRGCGEKETLLHCWWECKLIQPLWRTVWRFLKKTKNRTTI